MGRRREAACAAVLAAEAVGTLLLWAPLPFAWIWVGGRVYAMTGSLLADGSVALLGFAASAFLAMRGLAQLDQAWIALRRRAGHSQREGALTQVVVVSATLGIAAFLLWYYLFSNAFILPFMPSQ
jgi:signal transduction histidine kinase